MNFYPLNGLTSFKVLSQYRLRALCQSDVENYYFRVIVNSALTIGVRKKIYNRICSINGSILFIK